MYQRILSKLTKSLRINWIDLIKQCYWIYLKEVRYKYKYLRKIPRYTKVSVVLDNKMIDLVDSKSFEFMYDEIFVKEIYNIKTDNTKPFFIDGGANIGLATIYLKKKYPDAKITAFEADPYIFTVLKNNIESLSLTKIELINKALWNEEREIFFKSDKADGGRILIKGESGVKIKTTPLSRYISQRVDFLKLDIEGAEYSVLKEVFDKLHLVDRIFVEYHSFAGKPQHIHLLLRLLSKANFRVYISTPGLHQDNPFQNIVVKGGMDMQLNIFGIKED